MAEAAQQLAAAERALRITVTELFHAAVITEEDDGWSLDLHAPALAAAQDRVANLGVEGGLRVRGAVGALNSILALLDERAGVQDGGTEVVNLD